MIVVDNYTPVNHTKGRSQQPVGVVLHTIVGTAPSAIRHFHNPSAQVSAHYVIDLKGTVTRVVSEQDIAWAQGIVKNPTAPLVKERGGNPNQYLVSIEHEDEGRPHDHPRSDALYLASGSLLRDICARHGIPLDRRHVIAHREIRADKTCPGNLDIDRIIAIARDEQGEPVEEQLMYFKGSFICVNGRWPDDEEVKEWQDSGQLGYQWVQNKYLYPRESDLRTRAAQYATERDAYKEQLSEYENESAGATILRGLGKLFGAGGK